MLNGRFVMGQSVRRPVASTAAPGAVVEVETKRVSKKKEHVFDDKLKAEATEWIEREVRAEVDKRVERVVDKMEKRLARHLHELERQSVHRVQEAVRREWKEMSDAMKKKVRKYSRNLAEDVEKRKSRRGGLLSMLGLRSKSPVRRTEMVDGEASDGHDDGKSDISAHDGQSHAKERVRHRQASRLAVGKGRRSAVGKGNTSPVVQDSQPANESEPLGAAKERVRHENASPSPKPLGAAKEGVRHRNASRSPVRQGSRSPVRQGSRSPARQDSPSPVEKDRPSAVGKDSPSAVGKDSASPVRTGRPSPVEKGSGRASRSPVRKGSHSPVPKDRRPASESPEAVVKDKVDEASGAAKAHSHDGSASPRREGLRSSTRKLQGTTAFCEGVDGWGSEVSDEELSKLASATTEKVMGRHDVMRAMMELLQEAGDADHATLDDAWKSLASVNIGAPTRTDIEDECERQGVMLQILCSLVDRVEKIALEQKKPEDAIYEELMLGGGAEA
jgi:hypothetical protein